MYCVTHALQCLLNVLNMLSEDEEEVGEGFSRRFAWQRGQPSKGLNQGVRQVGMRATIEQLCAYKQRFPVPKFELPENIYTDDFDITEAEKVASQPPLHAMSATLQLQNTKPWGLYAWMIHT
jgi:hypothetical protein